MEKVCTDTLRSSAPKWSLGGDKQLLDILQNLHKKIITNCSETNTRLDELVNSLDTASIDLQNVNNKFMALSNSQFIERRVYDDDIDVAPEPAAPKEPEKQADPQGELSKLKQSIQILESFHETVEIVDSDSSGDEDEGRTVLKPKDVYRSRPLPHVIGSDLWRKRWHAGLVIEDSDTDTADSKTDPREEYSDSEPEVMDTQTDKLNAKDDTIVPPPPLPVGSVSPAPPAPPPPAPFYRPQQPVTATIFFDEPPPLECERDGTRPAAGGGSETEDAPPAPRRARVPDHLFGSPPADEIYQPSGEQLTRDTKDVSPVFDDITEPELFEKPKEKLPEVTKEAGFKKPVGGVSLFGSNKDSSSIGAAILKRHQPKSSDEESDYSDNKPIERYISKTRVTEKPATKTDNAELVHNEPLSSNNKRIIDDLFIKPKAKKAVANVIKENKVKIEEKTKSDLFGDDLFDDIDDIFTSKVVTKKPDAKNISIFDDDLFSDITVAKKDNTNKDKEKSIFDSDDDLFADIKMSNSNTSENNKIKDNSDELLSKNDEEKSKYLLGNNKAGHEKQKSIFDDDSDDDLFNFKSTSKKDSIVDGDSELFDKTRLQDTHVSTETNSQLKQNLNVSVEKVNTSSNGSDEKENVVHKNPLETNLIKSKQNNISDSDSENELFSGTNQIDNENKKGSTLIKENEQINEPLRTSKTHSEESAYMEYSKRNPESDKFVSNMTSGEEGFLSKDKLNVPEDKEIVDVSKKPLKLQSPSLFDDDEIDDLFSDNINKSVEVKGNTLNVEDKHTKSLTDHFMGPDHKKLQDEELFNDTPQSPIPYLSKYEGNTKNNDLKPNKSDNVVLISPDVDSNFENSNVSNTDILNKKQVVTEAPVAIEQSSSFTDIFNDIPPEFEKPKEPKKSKNVNALFDDDSDDETLFFKKNSDVVDEPPSPSYTNERFSIFHDEPPAIEVDFTPKPVRSNKNIIINSPDDDDIFNTHSEIKDTSTTDREAKNLESNVMARNLFDNEVQSVVEKDLSIEDENKSNSEQPEQSLKDSIKSTNTVITNNINKLQSDIKRQTDDETKHKSVGKLKAVNFNINVSTLLPGASPKKTKFNEELDGTASSKLPEPGVENSVNFEGDKDSRILDNKLSKDRAKIQVKRRPSTRRARKEAARKSGIDFGDSFDSTDNSSSIDQPEIQHNEKEILNIEKNNPFKGDINKIEKPSLFEDYQENLRNNASEDMSENTKESKNKNLTKVVYILNDEDIFSDANENVKEQNKTDLNKSISNSGSYLDATDTKSSSTTDKKYIDPNPTKNINNSAATDNKLDSNRNSLESNADRSKLSIFDLSDSDSELFGAKTIKIQPKAKLFDSDSDDDDLFGSKRDKPKAFPEKKEIKTVKGALFGDESDDDLFGAPAKSSEKPRSTPREMSAAEPVSADPLSLLARADVTSHTDQNQP